MNAKEFRIGNYVQTRFDSLGDKRIKDSRGNYPIIPIKITSIGIDCDFKPTPLTEEWLLNGGLKKTELEFIDRYFIDDDFSIDYNRTHETYNFNIGNEYSVELNYVHEWQNLYFALTGTELEKL